ncbi:MAG: type III polyketide synthase [Acidobacteria bacterium]|nr:MAG: type III polyketide synthase [Acidobacteriota bacterium]
MSDSPRIVATGSAFPPNYYDQETILAALADHLGERLPSRRRLEAFHRHVRVSGRHLALTIPEYVALRNFGDANDAWIRVATDVGRRAIRAALERAGIGPERVDLVVSTTVTGIATPSLEARLMNRIPFRRDLRRIPMFGLGCVAGVAGIARVADFLRGRPDGVALLLSVELCSLTLQRESISVPNMIASGLFGDGGAAVVVGGAESGLEGGPQIIASRSVFYRDTERVMGWDVTERGLGIVLSSSVPRVVRDHVREDVDAFLADHGLTRADIRSWVCHPGGPKVLEAMEEALELDGEALALTWDSLANVGNLSSTSVLLVLEQTMAERRPPPGSWGLMLAMGPAFCSELVLLRW